MYQGDELFNKKITTDELRKLIEFKSTASDCISDSIADKQLGGVAALYNILCEGNYSFLADEVGMGKTYQAIGLASLVWHLKPDARILFIAPRQNVQEKWVGDYNNFIKNNYKLMDNRVSDSLLKEPVHKPEFCSNIFDFIKKVEQSDQRAFFLRLTSFSFMLQSLGFGKEEITLSKINSKLKEKMIFQEAFDITGKSVLTEQEANITIGTLFNSIIPKFDLIVIDESQNIRNPYNLRNETLSTLFGLNHSVFETEVFKRKPVRKYGKVLLMSATPAHSKVGDIRSQLSYFEKDEAFLEKASQNDHLSKFMIRRFRRFEEKTKYQYRNEGSEKIVPKDSKELLFLALVQKKLERALEGQDGRNKNIYKIGFLEAFESYDAKARLSQENEDNQEGAEFDGNDRGETEAPDKRVIMDITRSYRSFMRSHGLSTDYPPHPKHGRITDKAREIFSSDEVKKLLVFVRRIASVEELRGRVTKVYDEIALEKVRNLFGIPEGEDVLSTLEKQLLDKEGSEVEEELDGDNEGDGEGQVSDYESEILDFFASKQGSASRAGGKFRKNFNKNKTLARFFEENYLRTIYTVENHGFDEEKYDAYLDNFIDDKFISTVNYYIGLNVSNYIQQQNKKKNTTNINNLINTVALYFLGSDYRELFKLISEVNSLVIGEVEEIDDEYLDKDAIKGYLKQNSLWNSLLDTEMFEFLKALNGRDIIKKEILKNWISKNLRMSDSIVDLASVYVKNREDLDSFSREFADYLTKGEATYSKKLRNRMYELIENFDLILKQINPDSTRSSVELITDDWNLFNAQVPVRGLTGGSKVKDKPIKQFNTPFFPDIIVCTDVLKEGVDLHLFCDEVWHYGLAWTPGDLEQRTGRIDRYFCEVHRNISKGATLVSKYPYVYRTIDQHQLHRVILNKVTMQKKLDMGIAADVDKDVNAGSVQELNVEELFDLTRDGVNSDPLPEDRHLRAEESESLEIDDSLCRGDKNMAIAQFESFVRRLESEGWVDVRECISNFDLNGNKITSTPLMMNLRLSSKTHKVVERQSDLADRQQAVIVELAFHESERVHVLRIKSPAGSSVEFDYYKVAKANEKLFRGIKFAYDKQSRNSHFTVSCVTDLLFFPDGRGQEATTSYEEFKDAVFRTAVAADFVEYVRDGGEEDKPFDIVLEGER